MCMRGTWVGVSCRLALTVLRPLDHLTLYQDATPENLRVITH